MSNQSITPPPPPPPTGAVSGMPAGGAIDAAGFYRTTRALGRSPLGIIALFIALVYSVAGIVAATEPIMPEALVWFIALFPVLVLGIFTVLLVWHHWKLYAPGDFADQHDWMRLQPGFADLKRTVALLQDAAAKGGALPDQLDALAKLERMMRNLERRTGFSMDPDENRELAGSRKKQDEPKAGEKRGNRGARKNLVRTMTKCVGGRPIDSDDPNKGRFGGMAEANGWVLEVVDNRVRRMENSEWFQFELRVRRTEGGRLMQGFVEFHLHDTFPEPVKRVRVIDDEALLPVISYGSFTVGAVLPDDRTRLELDLADASIKSSSTFKER